ETIEQAAEAAQARRPYRFSFDMLGEAARTAEDAERYFELYQRSILRTAPPDSISIKLSALHPRFEEAKRERIFNELLPRLFHLGKISSQKNINLTIDAEESERLELTLDVFEALAREFTNLGIAVQAYQKRALAVCDWLIALGRETKKRI